MGNPERIDMDIVPDQENVYEAIDIAAEVPPTAGEQVERSIPAVKAYPQYYINGQWETHIPAPVPLPRKSDRNRG